MANVSTRFHCDLILKINKLIQKFVEKTRCDPGHGVRIHMRERNQNKTEKRQTDNGGRTGIYLGGNIFKN